MAKWFGAKVFLPQFRQFHRDVQRLAAECEVTRKRFLQEAANLGQGAGEDDLAMLLWLENGTNNNVEKTAALTKEVEEYVAIAESNLDKITLKPLIQLELYMLQHWFDKAQARIRKALKHR